ncbi:MAG TPA: hypothetical protein DCQ83_08235 [Fibrobacteres bacterium]|nr:hypothetical protein [Fibrobacterota bacterium]
MFVIPLQAQQAPAESSDEAAKDTSSSLTSLSFLMPAEGDVFYKPDVRIVAYVGGTPPAAMLAVFDGFSLDRPLHLENGLLNVDLPGLSPGVHEFKLIFLNENGVIEQSRSVHFFVRVPEPKRDTLKGKLRRFGRVTAQAEWKGGDARSRVVQQSELKIRGDSIVSGSRETPLSRDVDAAAQVNYTIKDGYWEGNFRGLVRTDENHFRQPADRVSARLSYGPWAYLKGGDVYPTYNELILNGTRIRGTEMGAAVVTGSGENHWAYAKFTTGETKREIPAYVAEYDTGGGTRFDTVAGTPSQNLTAFRLGFGGGSTFDLGITVLKASEENGNGQFQALRDSLHGVTPVDNLVLGLDLRMGFWQDRIQIFGDYAGSLFTRDRSIGAFGTDSFDVAFNPKDYEWLFVFNPTTRAWQYLLKSKNGGKGVDPWGFFKTSSAYDMGVGTSLPFPGMVSETQLRFSHLGADYHSEGNPFLGSNPGYGWNLQQRFVVLDNRLFLGSEVSDFMQNLGLYKQEERGFKAEVRYVPGAYKPAFWVNGGLTSRVPQGVYPYQFSQDFAQFNIGGFHQVNAGPGTLHGSLLYGYTRSELELQSTDSSSLDSLLSFPVTQTHIINTAFQYRFRGSSFIPKLAYTFANNGIQKPTNSVIIGVQDVFMRSKLRGSADLLLSQYPKTQTENDLSFGEVLGVTYRIRENQSVNLRQRWISYGSRSSITAGAYYEMFL